MIDLQGSTRRGNRLHESLSVFLSNNQTFGTNDSVTQSSREWYKAWFTWSNDDWAMMMFKYRLATAPAVVDGACERGVHYPSCPHYEAMLRREASRWLSGGSR